MGGRREMGEGGGSGRREMGEGGGRSGRREMGEGGGRSGRREVGKREEYVLHSCVALSFDASPNYSSLFSLSFVSHPPSPSLPLLPLPVP